MLEFVRHDTGELFGAGGLFQQAAQDHDLAAGGGKGIHGGVIDDGQRDSVGDVGFVVANACAIRSNFRSRSGSPALLCLLVPDDRQSDGPMILPQLTGTYGVMAAARPGMPHRYRPIVMSSTCPARHPGSIATVRRCRVVEMSRHQERVA